MKPERWKRIDELLQAALEKSEEERAAFIAEACKNDGSVRREVESLLAYQQRASSFLETPAIEQAAQLFAHSRSYSLEGQTLSHYRLDRVIGHGGMGSVYLAHDSSLDRQVAVKFLSDELTADQLARRRLIREARAAAKLDHPNICSVYEVAEQEGQTFIVMQYVEGETLAEKIKREQMEIREVIDVAVQVADALAEAHSRGIVHRDIKPANIMLTARGQVKVLDFGLAKTVRREDIADSEIATESLISEQGVIAGTVPYMSPEQLRADPIDARSDIFSLGVVLYEMISGRQPFQAESMAEAISAILTKEPPSLTRYSTEMPPELERIIGKTLRKNRDERYQTIKDFLIDLKNLRDELDFEARLERSMSPEPVARSGNATTAGVVDQTASFPPGSTDAIHPRTISSAEYLISEIKSQKKGALAGVLIAGLLIAAAVWYLVLRPAVPNSTTLKTSFTQLTDSAGPELFPSLAPDGKSFIFGSRSSGNWDLYLQRVGGKNPTNLTKDSRFDDVQSAFSPDGEHIAFRSEREGGGIFLMGATGESVRRLTNFGYHPAWSPDGKEILCSMESIVDPTDRQTATRLLRVVNVATGEKRELASGDAVQGRWSPQGQRIAYWGLQKGGQRDIWTMPAAGGESVPVTNDPFIDWNPVWAPDGKYLYFSSNRGGSMNLWRVGIDEQTGKVTGQPEPVTTPSQYSQHISFSRDGHRVAYVQTLTRVNVQRVRFDPAGERTLGDREWITQGSRRSTQPNLSTDGEWLVFSSQGEPQEDLFVSSKDGSGLRQLTDDIYKDRYPRWSPDGKRIAAYSDRSGKYEIWLINPDGSGLRQLSSTSADGIYPVWSPDGTRVAHTIRLENAVGITDANKASNEHTPELLPRLDNPTTWFEAWSWSPDGRRLIGTLRRQGGEDGGIIAYSLESRSYEKLTDAGYFPIWLSDNRRALFLDQGKIHIVDSQTKKVHEILSVVPYAVGVVSISRNDRLIYYSIVQTEADVWMMTLE